MKKIFIGLAWPYANGSLHLGHVSSFIGADIIARYFRLHGDDVLFVSGSDCYGTPIAVEATELGIEPKDIADKYHDEFKKTLIDGLKFSYDIYTRTTTKHHTRVVQELFLDLYKKGFLYTKVEKALYSPFLKRFLPDRFVEGVCPKCGFTNARGDQCDECGSLLNPLELKNPKINPKILKREVASEDQLKLEIRESEHFYLKLSILQKKLEKFVEEKSGLWRTNAASFAKAFLKQGLQDRAVTRDTDWGVPIPLPGYESKRIYVWFEAVTGYLSASRFWSEERWPEFWQNKEAIHYYVHGKDNIPFHTIIWPAILIARGDLNLPDYIISSEFLSLEGRQFSKSRHWAVWLPDFLASFDPETLRYFLVANGPETSDADFSWREFGRKVNGELIGTFGNLVNRIFSFVKNNFPNGVSLKSALDDESKKIIKLTEGTFSKAGENISAGRFRAAFREILSIAEEANRLANKKEPWKKIADETKTDEVETDLAVLINVIRNLAILINPFLPTTSEKIYSFLGLDFKEANWQPVPISKLEKVVKVEPLYKKIEDKEIEIEVAGLGKAE